MPALFPLAKLIRKKPPKAQQKNNALDFDIKLDQSIAIIQVVKALGEMLPFPYLKATADVALRVLEPLRLARTNRQDFEALVQDITNIIVQIRTVALELSSNGATCSPAFQAKCLRFTTILSDISIELSSIRRDIVDISTASLTTLSIQRLIKAFQQRLQTEIQVLQVTTMLEIQSSVDETRNVVNHIQSMTDTIVSRLENVPPSAFTDYPHLENYVQLRIGELRMLQGHGTSFGGSEYHAKYNESEKTLKLFQGEDAGQAWIKEIKFYHELQFVPRLRQLFGFTNTLDRLSLVFHDHGVPLAEYWETLPALDRLISTGMFISDWNASILPSRKQSGLKSTHKTVHSDIWPYFWSLHDLARPSQVLPMVNWQGQLAAALSLEHEDQAFRHYGTTTDVSDIQRLQTALTHQNRNIPIRDPAKIASQLAFDLSQRHHYFCKNAQVMESDALLCIMTQWSAHDPSRPRFAAYLSIPLTVPQSLPLGDWICYGEFDPSYTFLSHEDWTSLYIGDIPDGQTRTFEFHSSRPHTCLSGIEVLQYIPTVIKSLPSWMRDEELEVAYERYLGLYCTVQVSFHLPLNTEEQSRKHPLLFLPNSMPDLSSESLDLAAYLNTCCFVSFDSDGHTRASLKQIAKAGYHITIGNIKIHHQENSLDTSQVEALCKAAELWDGFPELPPNTAWHDVVPPSNRAHSLDRSARPPQRREVLYDHVHGKDFARLEPAHSSLCDLNSPYECICDILDNHFRLREATPKDPDYPLCCVPCEACEYEHMPKKAKRTRSLDRFDRLRRSIARWIHFMNITDMDSHDLQFYYLESPNIPPWNSHTDLLSVVGFGNSMPRRGRSGISPWTQLVYPDDEPERRGRSRVKLP
ncbi:hypothetical protein DL96DRAFT_1819745 [Flagelloscypha sp. PMI_526]|nr:hypothetical protein DL96DRAFT_1819745 [Flagelloscypha sp. PMI_526]